MSQRISNKKNGTLTYTAVLSQRQKDGISLRSHSRAIAAFFKLGFGLVRSAAITLRMKTNKGPAIPMKKLKTMTNRLAIDGDLKKKQTMYVNPAAAGPKRTSKEMVALAAWRSLVINDSAKCRGRWVNDESEHGEPAQPDTEESLILTDIKTIHQDYHHPKRNLVIHYIPKECR